MNSQWVGSKPIRTNWATKKPASYASEGRGNVGVGGETSGPGQHMPDKPAPHHHRSVAYWNFFGLQLILVLYIYLKFHLTFIMIADIIRRSATRKSFKRALPQIAQCTAVASPIRMMKTQSAERSHRSAASSTSDSSETRDKLKRCCDSRWQGCEMLSKMVMRRFFSYSMH